MSVLSVLPERGAGIVAFAFGVPSTIEANQTIGLIVRSNIDNKPVYTQQDVPVGEGINVTYTEEAPGNPPPTLRIARGAVKWAEERELDELWVACAKPHLWRCQRDLKKAVREAGVRIKVAVCKDVFYDKNVWFCPDSTQPRTRTWWAWWSREVILKLMPFWIYKKVAG